MPVYEITPRDVLRVPARAMGEDATNRFPLDPWPLPGCLFHAIHAALHQTYPQIQLWEHNHSTGKNGRYLNRGVRLQRFGSLTTIGPFPWIHDGTNSRWLFPNPADHSPSNTPGYGLTSPGIIRNLAFAAADQSPAVPPIPPGPLDHPLASATTSPVAPEAFWLSKPGIESCLKGQRPADDCRRPNHQLYSEEDRSSRESGVAFSRAEQRRQGRHVLLRLRDHVSLAGHALLPLKASNYCEGLDQIFDTTAQSILLGGGGHLATLRKSAPDFLDHWLPVSPPVTDQRVKWLLLSPAIFPPQSAAAGGTGRNHPGGWLPNWICPDSGQILLRRCSPARGRCSREEWRMQTRRQPPLDCHLTAIAMPALVPVGGWSAGRHLTVDYPHLQPGPKPVWQAVPAGAVYFFEGPDAPLLADALAWHGSERQNVARVHHRRSTLMGEQGYGLGVCGPWEHANER